MAHVSPEIIGLDPLDFLRPGGGQRPAFHRFEHPIHHRIVAHSHEPLGRPQPHPLKIVGQRRGALRGLHSPMILFPAGLAAPSAQPALPPMSAAPVLHHFLTFTMLAFHSLCLPASLSLSIPVEQSPAFEGFAFAASGFTNPLSVSADSAAANFTATAAATVSLAVSDADCTGGTTNPGKFTLTRTGSTASALAVNFYNPTGSAAKGTDYTLATDPISTSSSRRKPTCSRHGGPPA